MSRITALTREKGDKRWGIKIRGFGKARPTLAEVVRYVQAGKNIQHIE